jgi:hypothetical protein
VNPSAAWFFSFLAFVAWQQRVSKCARLLFERDGCSCLSDTHLEMRLDFQALPRSWTESNSQPEQHTPSSDGLLFNKILQVQ